jgi:hypothetical protein
MSYPDFKEATVEKNISVCNFVLSLLLYLWVRQQTFILVLYAMHNILMLLYCDAFNYKSKGIRLYQIGIRSGFSEHGHEPSRSVWIG